MHDIISSSDINKGCSGNAATTSKDQQLQLPQRQHQHQQKLHLQQRQKKESQQPPKRRQNNRSTGTRETNHNGHNASSNGA
ncbi:hypothetical protein, conserved [Eimeria tenella]|uniref:Uncharacterized protein n=1 Tax=Eimeria tenella TaxID=5802 RepID=U6KYI4_EIMTE|nr:hypothetical protein, conserved [Eimeria tenella]CDJ43016.1 hypothetical protein, conserved [Eimeria tenella]|eukprot:XP_013233766.1 hypothetical protein, conserved [Eimeria tenella]